MITNGNGERNFVLIRRIPYPYQAMLSICSDLDSTPDRHVYFESMKFLNTTETTGQMGSGVGLEVGNSIYFDTHPDIFSYWNTDDGGREMIQSLIRSGHIDCLHSFGELANTRAHAERALEELSKQGCCLEVWTDHGSAPSNFGEDIMQGLGDMPDSPVYHADLSCDYGIRYVWRGRVTSIVGQDVSRGYGGIWNSKQFIASTKTIAKEVAKSILPYLGNAKYAMNKSNRILRHIRLRSGHEVMEFLRSNPYWKGVGSGATSDGISSVISKQMLDNLVDRQGKCILYTHLGKINTYDEPFGNRTRQSFRLLAQYYKTKKILVTTTRRLLGYCQAIRDLNLLKTFDGSRLKVKIQYDGNKNDLQGLSLYVSDPDKTQIFLNDHEVSGIQRNEPDETNQSSVSFPWVSLEFPQI